MTKVILNEYDDDIDITLHTVDAVMVKARDGKTCFSSTHFSWENISQKTNRPHLHERYTTATASATAVRKVAGIADF